MTRAMVKTLFFCRSGNSTSRRMALNKISTKKAGRVSAADYDVLVWILGEESTVDETFSAAERTLVQNFLSVPGRGLFVSGSELAWDLDNNDSFETAGQSVTFSAASLDGPSSYTVKVKATDPLGLSAEATATVNVFNVSPSVAASCGRYENRSARPSP